jgi:hypothetical protein
MNTSRFLARLFGGFKFVAARFSVASAPVKSRIAVATVHLDRAIARSERLCLATL